MLLTLDSNEYAKKFYGLFAAVVCGAAAAKLAGMVGASEAVQIGVTLYFQMIWLALIVVVEAEEFVSSALHIVRARSRRRAAGSVPKAVQFLIITFFVTTMFALEMAVDIVPNRYGFVELLLPVCIFTIYFDMRGGVIAALTTAVFAFGVFRPPYFTPIFEDGPVRSSFIAFAMTAVEVLVFTKALKLYYRDHAQLDIAGAIARGTQELARATRAVMARCCSREVTIAVAAVLAYALFWAIYGSLASENGPHIDSLEAYGWGREFRPGYFKHPPFWSWVAGTWFLIFPKTDFSFYFLSELNAGLGLLGTWALMGCFRKDATRTVALFMLLLVPFYQFNALRFNANTILLSLWPWTMYFFVLSIERTSIPAALACGLLAGLAMLSKYFGLVLIASCFIGAITHDNRLRYFRSAAPYVSVASCWLLFAPHVLWLIRNGFQPIIYLASKTEFPETEIASSYFSFIVANILYFIIPIAIILAARVVMPVRRPGVAAAAGPVANGSSFLTVLALAPFVLTLVAGAIGHTALAVPFGTPIFGLIPFVMVLLFRPDLEFASTWSRHLAVALYVICALAGPFVPYVNLRSGVARAQAPVREVAEIAPQVWWEETNTPLRYVTGSDIYSLATAYYAKENVSELRGFDFKISPWTKEKDTDVRGLLAICAEIDAGCLQAGSDLVQGGGKVVYRSLHRTIWGYDGEAMTFAFFIKPPQNTD
jgi:hypothetical protein